MTEYSELLKSISDEMADIRYKISAISNYFSSHDAQSTVLDIAQSIKLEGDNYRQKPIRIGEKETKSGVIYQVTMKRGHSIDFENEQLRDFVFKLLKAQDKRLARSEILNMKTPEKNDVQTIMAEYESDVEQIGKLEAEAEDLQNELDNIILRDVYDLDDREVNVIEDFLDTW